MADKCPYCKADLEFTAPYEYDGIYKRWRCDSTDSGRSTQCYEAELAAMRPMVRALAGYEPHYYPEKGFQCHYCHRFSFGPLDTFPHTATCAVRLSQGWVKKWKEI